jgi:NAD(P)-dependent dehydrogenase (short-subunit alcohol dehydrogenase family)
LHSKRGLIAFPKILSIELGAFGIRANAVLPGSIDGPYIQKFFEGRAKATHHSVEEIKKETMAVQSLEGLLDPRLYCTRRFSRFG